MTTLTRRHQHFRATVDHATACYVGTCPACRKPVLWDDPDGPVWTCPADLHPRSLGWEPPLITISEKTQHRVGLYSNCLEDYTAETLGLRFKPDCYERLPLHSKCYARGNY